MAKIIVVADQEIQGDPAVLLEESVYSVHLSTGHAAMQLVERLGRHLVVRAQARRRRDRQPDQHRNDRHPSAGH